MKKCLSLVLSLSILLSSLLPSAAEAAQTVSAQKARAGVESGDIALALESAARDAADLLLETETVKAVKWVSEDYRYQFEGCIGELKKAEFKKGDEAETVCRSGECVSSVAYAHGCTRYGLENAYWQGRPLAEQAGDFSYLARMYGVSAKDAKKLRQYFYDLILKEGSACKVGFYIPHGSMSARADKRREQELQGKRCENITLAMLGLGALEGTPAELNANASALRAFMSKYYDKGYGSAVIMNGAMGLALIGTPYAYKQLDEFLLDETLADAQHRSSWWDGIWNAISNLLSLESWGDAAIGAVNRSRKHGNGRYLNSVTEKFQYLDQDESTRQGFAWTGWRSEALQYPMGNVFEDLGVMLARDENPEGRKLAKKIAALGNAGAESNRIGDKVHYPLLVGVVTGTPNWNKDLGGTYRLMQRLYLNDWWDLNEGTQRRIHHRAAMSANATGLKNPWKEPAKDADKLQRSIYNNRLKTITFAGDITLSVIFITALVGSLPSLGKGAAAYLKILRSNKIRVANIKAAGKGPLLKGVQTQRRAAAVKAVKPLDVRYAKAQQVVSANQKAQEAARIARAEAAAAQKAQAAEQAARAAEEARRLRQQTKTAEVLSRTAVKKPAKPLFGKPYSELTGWRKTLADNYIGFSAGLDDALGVTHSVVKGIGAHPGMLGASFIMGGTSSAAPAAKAAVQIEQAANLAKTSFALSEASSLGQAASRLNYSVQTLTQAEAAAKAAVAARSPFMNLGVMQAFSPLGGIVAVRHEWHGGASSAQMDPQRTLAYYASRYRALPQPITAEQQKAAQSALQETYVLNKDILPEEQSVWSPVLVRLGLKQISRPQAVNELAGILKQVRTSGVLSAGGLGWLTDWINGAKETQKQAERVVSDYESSLQRVTGENQFSFFRQNGETADVSSGYLYSGLPFPFKNNQTAPRAVAITQTLDADAALTLSDTDYTVSLNAEADRATQVRFIARSAGMTVSDVESAVRLLGGGLVINTAIAQNVIHQVRLGVEEQSYLKENKLRAENGFWGKIRTGWRDGRGVTAREYLEHEQNVLTQLVVLSSKPGTVHRAALLQLLNYEESSFLNNHRPASSAQTLADVKLFTRSAAGETLLPVSIAVDNGLKVGDNKRLVIAASKSGDDFVYVQDLNTKLYELLPKFFIRVTESDFASLVRAAVKAGGEPITVALRKPGKESVSRDVMDNLRRFITRREKFDIAPLSVEGHTGSVPVNMAVDRGILRPGEELLLTAQNTLVAQQGTQRRALEGAYIRLPKEELKSPRFQAVAAQTQTPLTLNFVKGKSFEESLLYIASFMAGAGSLGRATGPFQQAFNLSDVGTGVLSGSSNAPVILSLVSGKWMKKYGANGMMFMSMMAATAALFGFWWGAGMGFTFELTRPTLQIASFFASFIMFRLASKFMEMSIDHTLRTTAENKEESTSRMYKSSAAKNLGAWSIFGIPFLADLTCHALGYDLPIPASFAFPVFAVSMGVVGMLIKYYLLRGRPQLTDIAGEEVAAAPVTKEEKAKAAREEATLKAIWKTFTGDKHLAKIVLAVGLITSFEVANSSGLSNIISSSWESVSPAWMVGLSTAAGMVGASIIYGPSFFIRKVMSWLQQKHILNAEAIFSLSMILSAFGSAAFMIWGASWPGIVGAVLSSLGISSYFAPLASMTQQKYKGKGIDTILTILLRVNTVLVFAISPLMGAVASLTNSQVMGLFVPMAALLIGVALVFDFFVRSPFVQKVLPQGFVKKMMDKNPELNAADVETAKAREAERAQKAFDRAAYEKMINDEKASQLNSQKSSKKKR